MVRVHLHILHTIQCCYEIKRKNKTMFYSILKIECFFGNVIEVTFVTF